MAIELAHYPMKTPGLSVVVIGRNEGARLGRCLASILEMDDPGCAVEIIYVDSASTDGSTGLAESMGARVVAVKPVRPTAALGRNAGWMQGRGSFVLFLDGDTILDPGFVTSALPAFEDKEVAIVWGHRREINAHASFYNRVLDLDWISAPGPTNHCGGDALVRRAVLERVGGYDETLIAGEEPEMCCRIVTAGYKILHTDRFMTGHDLAMTSWRQYWSRATRTGYAYAEVSERFRGTDTTLWRNEAKGNRIRATILLLMAAAGIFLSILVRSPWPLSLAITLFSLSLSSVRHGRSAGNQMTPSLVCFMAFTRICNRFQFSLANCNMAGTANPAASVD